MTSTQSTKQWSKICLASALEKLGQENSGDESSDIASLSAIAVAAIEQLTTLLGTEETFHENRRELKRISKSIRTLEPQLEEAIVEAEKNAKKSKAKDNSNDEKIQEVGKEEETDLGQYANAGVFEENDKKKNKFARLMGGAKKETNHEESTHKHSTFALTRELQKNVEGDLEKEFEMGRTHHGKKGLGAK